MTETEIPYTAGAEIRSDRDHPARIAARDAILYGERPLNSLEIRLACYHLSRAALNHQLALVPDSRDGTLVIAEPSGDNAGIILRLPPHLVAALAESREIETTYQP